VRINCSKETLINLDQIISDFLDVKDIYKRYLLFDFHKIWQIKESLESDLHPIMERFRNEGFSVVNTNLNVFEYVCYADRKHNSCINYNGDVFKCTARDFSTENREGILTNNGEIEWNDKLIIRNSSKFKNEPCFTCNIFPICGGGCSQKAMENKGKNYCIYNFDEDLKKRTIFEFLLNHLNDSIII
jgi:uncharacterized protein